ncbi:aspartate-semialdehyde dehydrogenase [Halothermothrix orenii]|nr:aspartate-semialdehyde dehydrogenase [Halothermothrix orenii]
MNIVIFELEGSNLSSYNIAVVGATGAVGREMVKVLEQRNFPVNKLKLLATERSAGTRINFKGETIEVQVTREGVFKDVDIALFSAGSGPSKKIAPLAVKEGAVVIDNSNAFRMDKRVPLVVPEINPEKIFEHEGIIANPNCSTIQMVVALKPIYDTVGIERIIVSTYQAVSGTGKKAIEELKKQVKEYIKGKDIESSVYPYQIAFNVLPHIDIFKENGYTQEEMKMVNETRKILNDPDLKVSATAARVPVFYGHSESVNVQTKEKITVDEAKRILNKASGIKVVDEPGRLLYPLPLMSEDDDNVLVGRIREDLSHELGLNMWIVANNLRKGAALNAVQIAEELIK